MGTKYIHTIDGQPATISDGYICFMTHYGKAGITRDSLAEIRKDQKLSARKRAKDGMGDDAFKIGYRRYSY